MGMIIIPLFIVGVGIGIFALVKIITQLNSKQIDLKQIIYGISLSIFLLTIIIAVYVLEKEYYAFSPAFRIPLFLMFLPTIIYLIFIGIKTPTFKYLANIVLVNIAFAGILGFGLFIAASAFLETIGIQKYY